jgi:exopolyphosphatase / guanosine-5'-triphosphate,3'-diphosphate pyrophosphatase
MEPAETASALRSPTPAPAPGFVRRAVVDVGTNSVKLLVADVSGRRVDPLVEVSEQTRLGRGFYENHRLQPAAITHTARAVGDYVAAARERGAVAMRVIATSAARDAINQNELVAAIKAESGCPVEILSGAQEADWVFRGVTSDPVFAGQPLLIVDVGGGSTEFILGKGDHQRFSHSFALGTVRLIERLPHSDPPTAAEWERCRAAVKEFLDQQVAPVIEPQLPDVSAGAVQLVGTGGTTSILARIELGLPGFERDRIEALRLTREQVRRQRERLWQLPLAERKKIVGLPADRADVILAGVLICEVLMERFDFRDLRASTRGVRFAAVMEERSG